MLERVRLACTIYDPAAGRYRFNYAVLIEIFAGSSIFIAVLTFLLRERRRSRRISGT
jgi:protein SCO1/2